MSTLRFQNFLRLAYGQLFVQAQLYGQPHIYQKALWWPVETAPCMPGGQPRFALPFHSSSWAKGFLPPDYPHCNNPGHSCQKTCERHIQSVTWDISLNRLNLHCFCCRTCLPVRCVRCRSGLLVLCRTGLWLWIYVYDRSVRSPVRSHHPMIRPTCCSRSGSSMPSVSISWSMSFMVWIWFLISSYSATFLFRNRKARRPMASMPAGVRWYI